MNSKNKILSVVSMLIAASGIYAAPLDGQVMLSEENSAWLVYNKDDNGDGKPDPCYLAGPGGPEGFFYSDFPPDMTPDKAIDFIIEHGGNVMVMHAVMGINGQGDLGNDANPLSNGVLDEQKMKQWDTWIKKMGDAGIIAYLRFYDDGIKHLGDDFIKSFVKRFMHHWNIIWDICEECNEGGLNIANVTKLIKDTDEHDHLVGAESPDKAVDIYTPQGEAATPDDLHKDALNEYKNADGNFCVLMAGHHYFTPGQGDKTRMSADKVRQGVWALVTAGTHFANHGLWEQSKNRVGPTPEECTYNRYCYEYMETIHDFCSMKPNDAVIKSGKGCAIGTNSHYVIYMLSGGNITIDLSAASGALNVEWYNPRTGKRTSSSDVAGGKEQSFSAPDNNDWVLQISSKAITSARYKSLSNYTIDGRRAYKKIFSIPGPQHAAYPIAIYNLRGALVNHSTDLSIHQTKASGIWAIIPQKK